MTAPLIPKAFIWRRLHSLAGLWLVLFVIQHLLTNSQAALFLGDDGRGFIHSVNAIHDLPFLPIIEIFLLGVPIAIHALWGIKYLRTAEYNSFSTDGSKPSLREYSRNRAFTWQRITSWILLVGIVAHVLHMRFIEYPTFAQKESQHFYMVRLDLDEGLPTLAKRLDVTLYHYDDLQSLKALPNKLDDSVDQNGQRMEQQQEKQHQKWVAAIEKRSLEKEQVMAVAKDFGTAELLIVRETFKMPIMIVLYTLLVIATTYHAFNGLWTVLITWGITLTDRSQRLLLKGCQGFMLLITFLGLAAVWLTYWVNLKS